jgi:hypothetical protein
VDILTLAGQIEYDQDSLEEARRDLTRARQLSPRACLAAWYLGLVAAKRQVWPEAGDSFELAMYCYRQAASDVQLELAQLRSRPDLDPEYVREQEASLQKSLAECQQQERWAAMNSAKGFANAGVVAKIDALVAVATLDPSLAEDIEALRAYVRQREESTARR